MPDGFSGAGLHAAAQTGRRMPALCKDVEFAVLDACGHWTMWEQPDALNGYMLEWLERRFPASGRA